MHPNRLGNLLKKMVVMFKLFAICQCHPLSNPSLLRSRGSTHRSRTNPLGRKDSPACRLGNLLACRALFLVVVAASKGVFWILEQPQSSVMQCHPLFQKVIQMLNVRKINIAMSKFGAPTPKRTPLYTCI